MSEIIDISNYIPHLSMYLLSFLLSSVFYPSIIDGVLNHFPPLIKKKESSTKKGEKSGEKCEDDDAADEQEGDAKNEIKNTTKEKEVEVGKYIGVLERALILIALYINQYSLIPMLLTAKSIIRFPEVSKGGKEYAEYYLVGTLTSFLLAILTGIIVVSYLNLLNASTGSQFPS